MKIETLIYLALSLFFLNEVLKDGLQLVDFAEGNDLHTNKDTPIVLSSNSKFLTGLPKSGILIGGLTLAGYFIKKQLDSPNRRYNRLQKSVKEAYDKWTDDGILQHYWGDHIHFGYYSEQDRLIGSFKKDFKQAKVDMIDKMLEFADVTHDGRTKNILDVGCGIGGSAMYMAKKFKPHCHVTGITFSPKQAALAQKLCHERNLTSMCSFKVMDAQEMNFPDEQFDVVWVCESTEHMPDKERVIGHIARVLKPGGKLVVAVWSQRDDSLIPFSVDEKERLLYLYDQWSHPPFISIRKFTKFLENTGQFTTIKSEDWTQETLPSMYHNMLLGVLDPMVWIKRPRLYFSIFKDTWCLFRMNQAFRSGLMQYGLITATKKKRGLLA